MVLRLEWELIEWGFHGTIVVVRHDCNTSPGGHSCPVAKLDEDGWTNPLNERGRDREENERIQLLMETSLRTTAPDIIGEETQKPCHEAEPPGFKPDQPRVPTEIRSEPGSARSWRRMRPMDYSVEVAHSSWMKKSIMVRSLGLSGRIGGTGCSKGSSRGKWFDGVWRARLIPEA